MITSTFTWRLVRAAKNTGTLLQLKNMDVHDKALIIAVSETESTLAYLMSLPDGDQDS